VRVEEHQKFARNNKNYENLDELMTDNGPTLDEFINDLVTASDVQKNKEKMSK
jgi:hypothetical protein